MKTAVLLWSHILGIDINDLLKSAKCTVEHSGGRTVGGSCAVPSVNVVDPSGSVTGSLEE